MKKNVFFTLALLFGYVLQATAYDFQAGNLFYTIISTYPPQVSVDGHIDGQDAQGELIIPETVEYGNTVFSITEIGFRAFDGCTGLNGDLVLPNTITRIRIGAFSYCSGFSALHIPNSVTAIEPEAFAACVGFTGQLVIPNSVTSLSVYEPTGVYYLGAFQSCTGFTSLVLSNSASIIGDYCFAECTGLTGDLIIPNGVEEIWIHAFANCIGLTGIEFPSSLKGIGARAFFRCTSLTSLTLPNMILELHNSAFAECTSLNSLDLQCTSIWPGRGVFSKCTSLPSVFLPEGMVQTGHSSFEQCTSLMEIGLPSTLRVIDEGAFFKCTSLEGVLAIPDKVKRIESLAFYQTGYSQVIFSDSLQYLSEKAFQDMPNLETMVLKSLTPPLFELGTNQSHQIPRDILIIVPCGTLEAYQTAEGWNEFTNIQEGNTFSFSAISENQAIGSANILKEATCDDMSVEVEALPNEGCAFLYWEANGEQVSAENPYSFILEQDTWLVAHFSGTGVAEKESVCVTYPNPARDQLRLQYSPDVQPKLVEFYDLQGRLVRAQSQGLESLDMSQLPTGTYTMRVTMEDGQTFSDKVVKE